MRHTSLDAKQDGEGVRPTAGPGVDGPRMNVGPRGLRVGLAYDEEPALRELAVALGRERELRVVAVFDADVPEGFGVCSHAGEGGEQM